MKTAKILTILVCLFMAKFTLAEDVQVVIHAKVHCDDCKDNIMKNISYEDGVEDLKVIVSKKMIAIKFDNTETTAKKLADAITKLGYEVFNYTINGKEKVTFKNGKIVKTETNSGHKKCTCVKVKGKKCCGPNKETAGCLCGAKDKS